MTAVLLLSTTTGYQLRSFNEGAERIGVEILFGTDRCKNLEDPWQDRAIPVRFHQEDASLGAIVAAARQRRIGGVIAVGDRPVVLAARVASALGIPGNPPDAAAASANKLDMRRRLTAAGLPAPWFRHLPLPAHGPVETAHLGLQFPCVVKPLGMSGSRGVIRADTPPQLAQAIDRVRALLARKDVRVQRTGLEDAVIIEGYIEGREFAIEGVLTRGRLQVFAIFDKPDPLDGPFFEETIYVTPSALSPSVQGEIRDAVQRAAAALGLVHGAVHAECRVGQAGVFVLEVAARPIGGLCSRVLRFAPFDSLKEDGAPAPCVETQTLEELLLRHTIGQDVSAFRREPRASGVMMIPIPRRGVYRRVDREEDARAVPLVEDIRITAKQDQLLEPLPEGASYLGFIFARGGDPERVTGALREAHRRLQFTIDPAIDVVVRAT